MHVLLLHHLVVSINKTRSCGAHHELLTVKFRLKLKKLGKTNRPFRYDLNQIPYDYTVKVANRFKGLNLKDWVPEEIWMEVHDIVQETGIKPIPQEKEMQKGKIVVWGVLTNSNKRREAKGKGEKKRYTHLNAEFQKTARRDKKAFLSKQIVQTNRGKQ